MKICAKCKISKDKMNFNKCKRTIDGLQSYCRSCANLASKAHNTVNFHKYSLEKKTKRLENIEEQREKERLNRIKNADKISKYKKKSDKKCAEKIKKHNAEYYLANKQKINVRNDEWRKENKDKIKEQNHIYFTQHQAEYNARTAKRKAAKLQATPPWLTKQHLCDIIKFYEEAKKLTKETGIIHHVDHIVPLQGKTVRGLHVPWNLQILTAEENLKKNNRTDVKEYTEEVEGVK